MFHVRDNDITGDRRLVSALRPGSTDNLVVCLNGYRNLAFAAPGHLLDTRLEGFRRLETQNAHLIWFAEQWCTWYLEHEQRILRRLVGYIRQHGIRTVKFIGNSAGAYASIRIATLLDVALETLKLDVAIVAFAINPQTGFRPALIEKIRARCWLENRNVGDIGANPVLLEESVRQRFGGDMVDLGLLLKDHKARNLAILIFYDSENLVECGFRGDLPAHDYIAFIGNPLNRGHGEGCEVLWTSPAFWETFNSLLPFGTQEAEGVAVEPLSLDYEKDTGDVLQAIRRIPHLAPEQVVPALPDSLPPLAKLYARSFDPRSGGYLAPSTQELENFSAEDVKRWPEFYLFEPRFDSPDLETAGFLYAFARMAGARCVLETNGGIGFSTSFLAAAVHDNGGGAVIAVDPQDCFRLWSDSPIADIVMVQTGDLASLTSRSGGAGPRPLFDLIHLTRGDGYQQLMSDIMRIDQYLKVGGAMLLPDTIRYDCLAPVVLELAANPRFDVTTFAGTGRQTAPQRASGMTIVAKRSDDRDGYPLSLSQRFLDWREMSVDYPPGARRSETSEPMLTLLGAAA